MIDIIIKVPKPILFWIMYMTTYIHEYWERNNYNNFFPSQFLSAFLHNDDNRFLIEHKGNLEVLYNYLLLKNDLFFEIACTFFIELSGDLSVCCLKL